MRQVFHNHELWEDHQHGMYKLTCENLNEMIAKCKQLLTDPELLYSEMRYCATNWKHAAEQNMSNANRNRQAWLGQASCCHYANAPEYVTKMAWRLITDEQRKRANEIADKVIEEWEFNYAGYGKQTALFN